MSSFREIRDLLLLSFDDGVLSDEEFVILYECYRSRNPEFTYSSYARFSLEEMDDSECLAEFRVRKQDLPVLAEVLRIPGQIICRQRTVCGGTEALCMLLRRLSYPCHYSDLIQQFGRPVPEMCKISNTVMDIIFDNHGHRLSQWNPDILNPQTLQIYAETIHAKGAPLENCFGFIDGTVRPISRPGKHQRVVYNDHKRVHS